jgi:hypothetical protein
MFVLNKSQLTQMMMNYTSLIILTKIFDCSIGINSLTILEHTVSENSKER